MSRNGTPTLRSDYERARLQRAMARALAQAPPAPIEQLQSQARCRCGRRTSHRARFCDRCGAPLARGPSPTPKFTEAVRRALDKERRGSTRLPAGRRTEAAPSV